MKLEELRLRDLQPSQFYVSAAKLRAVEEQLRPGGLSGLAPIPVKLLDGRPVMTDGHTRAAAALRAGLDAFPLVWDEDDLDWEAYRLCVEECRRRGVCSPADLIARVVSEEEYREKWDGWCDAMQAQLRRSREQGEDEKERHMWETTAFTNMCMIRQGTKVVVIRRLKKDWPGVTFPGGHVEPGESFTDAVRREVWEETGLTIRVPQLCGVKDWVEDGRRSVVLLYRTEQFTGKLRSSAEGEVWWEELDALPGLDLSLDMPDMLRVFTEDDLSEFFYRLEDDRWIHELK